METAVADSQVCDWVLRGEGGANIVLGYTGNHPSLVGKVLRIPKQWKRQVEHDKKVQILDGILWRQELGMESIFSEDKYSTAEKYAWCVLGPKLGHQFVSTQTVIDVPKPLRPSHDLGYRGFLFDDATLFRPAEKEINCGEGPVISIEVKPKCGFLPPGPVGQAAARFPKFTLKQMLKLQQGRITSCSHYNPLDMFSGDAERMNFAFRELLKNPQNNLKVFINGEYIAPSSQGYHNSHAETLLGVALEKMVGNCVISVWKVLCSMVTSILLEEGILSRVLALQKLDGLGIDVVYSLYQQLLGCKEDDLIQLMMLDSLTQGDSTSSEYADTPDDTDNSEDAHQEGISGSPVVQNYPDIQGTNGGIPLALSYKSPNELVQSLRTLKEYLMAVTAKDCSIFVTFYIAKVGAKGERAEHGVTNKSSNGKTGINAMAHGQNGNASRCSQKPHVYPKLHRLGESSILYKVVVADLDLKHVSKVAKHFNMNRTLNRIAAGEETIHLGPEEVKDEFLFLL